MAAQEGQKSVPHVERMETDELIRRGQQALATIDEERAVLGAIIRRLAILVGNASPLLFVCEVAL
jgi:hypothetical protein